MIRAALVSDTHADEHNRFDDHETVMSWIARDVVEQGADFVMHGGDWWERARTTDAERAAVKRWVLAVTEELPLVGVAGNHDGAVDVEWLGKLRTKHPAQTFTSPGVAQVKGCAIGCVPWPRKANLLAAIGMQVSMPDAGRIANECLQNVLRGIGAEMRETGLTPRILLGHFMIDGALTDHSQPLVGADMAVSLADLSLADATFIAAGHIHSSANAWDVNGVPCVYPGAPRHVNYGEAGPNKGYVLADFDEVTGRCVSWRRVAAPCTPMHLFEGVWRDGAVVITSKQYPSAGRVAGADCRLRYTVDGDQRDAARAAFGALREEMLAAGAVVVTLEERVSATARARSAEVAKAVTVPDQMAAMWAAKRPDLSEERRARLVSKLDQIRD